MNNDNETIENNEMPEKKKRSKLSTFLGTLAALLALALAASLIWIFHITNNKNAADMGLKNANGQVTTLQSQITDLNIQLDTTAQALRKERAANEAIFKENDSLRNLFPIYIKKLEVANADGSGRPISTYGNDIAAASSMYLLPRITYYGFRPGEKIELQVNQSAFKVSEANKKLELARTSTAKADENLRTANLGFREGVISATTVMEAQTAWLQAQSQKIDAEIDVKLSQVNLQKALGTLQ